MKPVRTTLIQILLAILALAIVSLAALLFTGLARFNQPFGDVIASPISIPTDPDSLALGEKWALTLCANCHGADLAGQVLLKAPAIGVIAAPNLTPGGVTAGYTTADWVRAIRHGVGPDDYPLLAMPSDGFYYLSDEDLGALIAYIEAVPEVENPVVPTKLRPWAYVLITLGEFGNAFPAENIPLVNSPQAPAPGVTVAYGNYLAQITDCDRCHGANLAGGPSPLPISLPGPNITPGGTITFWTPEEFIAAMRTGVTPYGRQINPEHMPWLAYAHLTDNELTAILTYLQWLPALDSN